MDKGKDIPAVWFNNMLSGKLDGKRQLNQKRFQLCSEECLSIPVTSRQKFINIYDVMDSRVIFLRDLF